MPVFETIWDRAGHTVDSSDARRVATRLAGLRAGAGASLTAAADGAARLRALLAALKPTG